MVNSDAFYLARFFIMCPWILFQVQDPQSTERCTDGKHEPRNVSQKFRGQNEACLGRDEGT